MLTFAGAPPISIIIWERMLKYVGHLMRAQEADPTKAVAFEHRDGHWVPKHLTAPRARGRPNDEWAAWAWAEARTAMAEVAASTSSHIASFPSDPRSLEAHQTVASLMSDDVECARLCYIARYLMHQSLLTSLRAQRPA